MKKTQPSVFGGAMIAAGTMIGAGMLTLPIVSAGMWFSWMIFILLLTTFFMQNSAEEILEVNLSYPEGSSFHTLVKDNLGKGAAIINGLSVAFVLYILLYAYIDGSGSVIQNALFEKFEISISKVSAAIVFALIASSLVWWGAKAVDRVSTILMIAMFTTLFASLTGLLKSVSVANLFEPSGTPQYAIYAFASLPFFLTSFCFHASVPSFVKYYGRDGGQKIRLAIIIGMIITLVFYLIWTLGIMGNIPRAQFLEVANANDDLVWLLNTVNLSQLFRMILEFFMFFAVVTSFLGAGLGLFDYIADLCKFDDSALGRTKTALITFIPPTLLGASLPGGFIVAIGFAGLFAAIWSVIIPGMMVLVHRKKQGDVKPLFRAMGGKWMPYFVIIYGVVAALSHLLVEVFHLNTLNFFAQ